MSLENRKYNHECAYKTKEMQLNKEKINIDKARLDIDREQLLLLQVIM
jgi:hypothetical protein